MAATFLLWNLFSLTVLFGMAASSHFRGAVIEWRPLEQDGQIEITHRIAWRRSFSSFYCDQSTIDSGTLSGGGNLACRVGCSGNVGSMSYQCTDFSTSEDWSAGQRSYQYNTNGILYFEASYSSCCWISTLVIAADASWEVRVKGNLAQRVDTGKINNSPISANTPIIRLQHGCNHTITIPVVDVDGDDIRCRWSLSSLGECAGVCQAFPATLNEINCSLQYAATDSTGWYAVALQIEDFATREDTIPFSSVPLQFLVNVFSSSIPCVSASRPELVGITRVTGSCVGVPFNATYHEPIIAMSGGAGVSIIEIVTVSPIGLTKSTLAMYGEQQWFVNVTWTPTQDQSAPNIFCFSAMDSIGLTSPQHCITLLGGVEAPTLVSGSMSPNGEIFPNHSEWSMQFDKPFFRPSNSRWIRVYEESGGEVISIDVALPSSPVTYPNSSLDKNLSFTTNYLFVRGRKYYVLLEPGIAVGPEICGPESPAIRDSRIWVVIIALCPKLFDPINGMVAVTGYQLDDTATYSCNMGFELVGSATTICTQLNVNSAAFSPVPPVCRPLCLDPVDPTNGRVTFTANSVGDTAAYSCNTGFELVGSATVTCTQANVSSAAFSPVPPVCRPLCPDPVDLLNGMVTLTGISVDDTATYSCNVGFELVGSTTATCTQVDVNSATFSPVPPVCKPLCPNPFDPLNGMVTFTGNSVDDTATYSCNMGFELVGSATTTCTQLNVNFAAFSPVPPVCRPLCLDPVDPTNGIVTFTGNSVGDTATYSCNMGFELVGSATVTCTQLNVNSATFSPVPPVCRPLCLDPVDPTNGIVTFTGNSVGDTATYSCNMGFELVGSATVTCTQLNVNSATFSPVPPVCRPLCLDPVDPTNGIVTFTANSVGDTATYSCNMGFELVGSATVTCTQLNVNSATFSPVPPVCRPLCLDPVDPTNGMVTFSGNSVGDTATYSCNIGFELVGSATVTCTQVNVSSTTFSPVPPVCRPLCPDPDDLVNGMMTFTGISVDDTATYSCNVGFKLVGSTTATCTQVHVNSATFSPVPPVCKPLCPNPFDPLNGMVTFTGNSVDDTATYSCNVGFQLVGSTNTTCIQVDMNSAAFFPIPPICRPLCSDPVDPVNGMVTFTGISVDDTATYSCNMGFELVGSTTATCTQVDVNSATFLPVTPVCRPLCPVPVDPVNGTVTSTGNSIHDTSTYSCDTGFELVGSATVTCTQVNANSATFSPVPPVCRPDVTPPTLSFMSNPIYSNENITIRWIYNEDASSFCTLQTPSSLKPISCNQSLTLTHQEPGLHSVFIQGTDTTGNVASSIRHTWTVDLTPPQVRLSSAPSSVSMDTEWTFQFYCLNEWRCTFTCSLNTVDMSAEYTPCSGIFQATDLQNAVDYRFSVLATDGVGNVGNPVTYQWSVDTAPPNVIPPNDVTLPCGNDYSPESVGFPVVTDNEDLNPSIQYADQPSTGCTLIRIWTATDEAGNQATSMQIIVFTTPQAPQVISPTELTIPCGNIEDAAQNAEHANLTIIHPCGRSVNATFMDSTEIDRCGFTFTRSWLLQDDCGTSHTFQQIIHVLDQQLPNSPANGEVNTRLDVTLLWPQFPGAYSYQVFVWEYETDRPHEPTAIVDTHEYTTPTNYPPGTRLLWQIEYITDTNMTVPSPIWGFMTQSFPDLSVSDIIVPDYAFSGQQFDISWTVINVGNISTSVHVWYDAIYIGRTTDFTMSRQVHLQQQNRFVDPEDGYVSQAVISLEENDIGNYYVFVETDIFDHVNDIDRSNNRRTSVAPVEVNLTPPPNLIVDTIVIPASTFSGQDISVRWTVRNDGVGVTTASLWYDQIFWSQDEQLDMQDLLLGTYQINGPLTPGALYSRTVTISVPDVIYGNFSIVVITDSSNQVFEHISEDDNSKTSEVPIVVILSPPPDLVVSYLEAQDTFITGMIIRVRYNVSNFGAGEPFESFWKDELVLTSLTSGVRYTLDQPTHYGTLLPGHFYTGEVLYAVSPMLIAGRFNLTVHTDYQNDVFELDSDGNNVYWKEIQIKQQLPDLSISNVDFSVQTTIEGNTIHMNYSITNQGMGSTVGAPWSNIVGLSRSQIYTSTSLIVLEEYIQRNEILSGNSCIKRLVFEVPIEIYGQVYLHIQIDSNNRILEENEVNNIKTEGAIVIPAIFPDLALNDVQIGGGPNIQSGDTIEVNWTVSNQGNGLIQNTEWIDEIFFGNSSQFNSLAVKLADTTVATLLKPQDIYNISIRIQIPPYFNGIYYLFVSVDRSGAIEENGMLGNNIANIQLFVSLPPSPDLRIADVEYSYIESERVLALVWTVVNEGNSMSTEQFWLDQVSFSSDPTFNHLALVMLGQVEVSGQLESFAEYKVSRSFVVPHTVYGEYYVFVTVDSSNSIVELLAEENNIGRSQGTLSISQPPVLQLRVQIKNTDLPTSLTAGQNFLTGYEVINFGEVGVDTTSWIDGIYLSSVSDADRDTVLESGILLSSILNNRELAAGERYEAYVDVTIPYGINQLLYLAVVVDINEDLGNPQTFGGSILSLTVNPISIETGPLPDLCILASSTYPAYRGGQPATVSFEVLNKGENSAVGDWYDTIYLSLDAFLDPFDTRLKTVVSIMHLEINESYQQTIEVFIPFDLPSQDYYLFLVADISNRITELYEGNNIGFQVVLIQETVSTDIVVASVNALPTNLNYGDELSFQWNLRNNGSLEADGYKCDTLYLSVDRKWDITDYQLDSLCENIIIQPHEGDDTNDERYMLATIAPFIAQQNYTGIIRTRSNIRDFNLENNIGYTDSLLTLNAPSLTLGSVATVALMPGEEKVYRIDFIPGERTLVATLSVSTDSDFSYHDIFLRYNEPPTGFLHDAFSKNALSSNQTAVVRTTRNGTYYLRIVSSGEGSEIYETQILVKIARFEIIDILPSSAAPLGNVTILFSGTLFSNFLQASLVSDIQPDEVYTAIETYWFSSEEVYATFDITTLGFGTYTVMLTDNISGTFAQLASKFDIIEGIPGHLSAIVRGPRPLRAGENGIVEVFVANTGNTDILTPIMTLSTGGNALLQLAEENSLLDLASEVNFLPLPTKGPGGILPPGSSTQVYFQVYPSEDFIGRVQLLLSYFENSENPHIYLDQKDNLKPPGIPENVWNTIWSNFLSSVGITWASLNYRVSEILTTLSLAHRKIYSSDEIINYQLQVAHGLLTGDILLEIQDIADEGIDTLLPLAVQRQYSAYIHKRRTIGPLGMGWLLPWWEMKIQKVTSTEVEFWNGRELVVLDAQAGGIYSVPEIDLAIVVQSEGITFEDSNANIIYTFDQESGLLIQIESTLNNDTITLKYFGQQWPVRITHSNGKMLKITYTSSGLINYVDLVDEEENIIQTSLYTYDGSQQQLVMVTIRSISSIYTYNNQGDLTSIDYATGARRTIQYDDNNLLCISESYSTSGELIASVNVLHSWNGNIAMMLQPNNQTLRMIYDTSGTVILASTLDGIPLIDVDLPGSGGKRILLGDEEISATYFDREANTVFTSDANGNQIEYKLGENNELQSFTDSAGNIYTTDYDGEGRISQFQNPDGTATMLIYDNVGRIADILKPDGSRIYYAYDTDDNIILKQTGGQETSFEYNNQRCMVRATNKDGTMEIMYDNNGMPLQILYPNGHGIFYGYNDQNQRVYMADNFRFNITYHYDGKDRLSQIQHAESGEMVAQFEYSPLGELIQKTLGNGAYTTYSYASKRLSVLTNYFPDGTLSSRFVYEYDRKGRPIAMITATGSWTYTYDAQGQLTGWRNPDGDTTEHTYDGQGNRIVQTRNGNEFGYSVDSMNRYTIFNDTDTFVYDKNGNLAEKQSGGKREYFVFNAEGKLVETETAAKRCSYFYDALGNLNRKNCSDSTTFQYLIDPFGLFGADVIAEISNSETTYFIHSFEQGLVAAIKEASTLYYEFNGDGSVISIMNSEAVIENSYRYDPFGRVLYKFENIHNTFLFIGKLGIIQDEELQDIYMMRSRHYDGQHGRFISQDPIGLSGSGPNFYMYAQNSPLIVKDPTGRILPLLFIPTIITQVAIGGALRGAAIGVASYMATSYITPGSSITLAGTVGAAVSGGFVGAFTPFPVGTLEKIAVPILAGVYGTGIERAIDGMPTSAGEIIGGSILNLITDHFAGKYLGKLGEKLKPGALYNSIKPLVQGVLRGLRNHPKSQLVKKFLKDVLGSSVKDIIKKIRDGIFEGAKILWSQILEWIRSIDPNDILGPAGFGVGHFIPADLTLGYKIRFENDPDATAPAQRVLIRHRLDNDLDLRTFRVGTFGFGNFTREIPLNRGFLQEIVNVTVPYGVFVRIRAGIDYITGEASWDLQALDPVTGEPPVDPTVGFLPPNNGTNGQGFVTFTVQTKEQLSSLTRVDAKATIVFDQNEPIDTPPIFNTIDKSAPTVNLTILDEFLNNGTLALRLHKSDTGSGVQEVDIYQLTELGVQPLLIGSSDSLVILPLLPGSQYKVFSSAVDNVGNRRPLVQNMEEFLLIDFPIIEGLCPNFCSQRGNCTAFGTCLCEPGYYGNDCSRDTPQNEPPILEISSLGGIEDNPVSVQISASLPDPDSSPEGLIIRIMNVPLGTTFTKGSSDGDAWVFTQAEFGDTEVNLPQDFSGDVFLEAMALHSGTSRTGSLRFYVQPVADPPQLHVMGCYDPQIQKINLSINGSVIDVTGSENLTVFIYASKNFTLSVGQMSEDGGYILISQDLPNIELDYGNTFEPFSVFVSAVSTERMNGDTAFINTSVLIDYCGAITMPTETVTPGAEAENLVVIIGASVAGGVTALLFLILVLSICLYCYCVGDKRYMVDPGEDTQEMVITAGDCDTLF